MKKPLLLSLAAAALIVTNLSAESTMYERFEAMEREMNKLKQEIAELKAQKESLQEEEESEAEAVASDDAAEDTEVVASAEEAEEEESDEDDEYIPTTEDRLFDIEESIAELNRNTSGSHLKFQVDYRFAIENMSYEMTDGSKPENDAFMTNRLWIDMGYKATNNLSFIGQLAYNKAFGQRSGIANANNTWETIDWIANENAYDDEIRVRSAYFLWQDQEFFGLDIPWTFSIGRRPSTNGQLVNLRDDDHASSPIGHAINVEFDGASSQFTLNKGWGTSVKLCLGRGMSNAAPKFASTPYAEVSTENTNIDLAGLIFTPYEDRQYKISSMYYYASNLIDANALGGFDTVGGMHSGTVYAMTKGIGNGWSDFLDYTTVFASFAFSKTDPKDGAPQGMLGSTESETGTSFWVGAQFPSLISDYGKWGVEYNHGSKYWRSMTYGEDTNIGSKVAARGDAYEVYFTEYLVEDILSLQLRYTYIDYEYSGSNSFFGDMTGEPIKISNGALDNMGNPIVESAQDIRLYIRYKY